MAAARLFTSACLANFAAVSLTAADLETLPAQLWRDLERATTVEANPFRTPVFGTTNLFECSLRVVVLRRVDAAKRQLICYSDARAQKVHQLKLCEQAHWLFYDPARRVQLRISAGTMVHQNDKITSEHWQSLPLPSRRNYCAKLPPGTDIHAPADAIAPELKLPTVTKKQLEIGYENFAVVVSTVDQIEFLQLADEGNVRAVFNWTAVNWSGLWLVP